MVASSRHSAGRRGRALGLMASVGIIAVFAAVLVACGPGDSTPENATQAMTAILGRAPTGQAKTIAKKGQMVAANTEDFPPLSYRDEDSGKLVGFDVEVAKAVGEQLALKVRFAQPEWEAVPAGLSAGRFDVSIGSLSVDQGLEGEVAYSKPYYYTTGQLVVRTGGTKLKSAAALAGKTVGAGIHTVFYRWLQTNTEAKIEAFAGDADALDAVEAGKVDAVLTSGLAATQAVKDGKGVELSGSPLFAEPMSFVVLSGEKDWLRVLNATIAELRANGTLSDLSKDWLGTDFTSPKPKSSASAD